MDDDEIADYLVERNDRWGHYTPSTDTARVPSFPCAENGCTVDSRKCDNHRRVLFVKILNADNSVTTIEIPFGKWECIGWYKERVRDIMDYPVSSQKIIFGGRELRNDERHSGLQILSTLHLVLPKKTPKSARF